MDIKGKIIIVTGGAKGIGRALVERFHSEGAGGIAVADIDLEAAQTVADRVQGTAVRIDAGSEADILDLIKQVERKLGAVDIFCGNAGVIFHDGPSWTAGAASNDAWQTSWNVNVMQHVYAARALVPKMIERGEGQFVIVASAAGLLNQIGATSYSATKHAAVSFAESLAITHGNNGIGVTVVCPQYVKTDLAANIKSSVVVGDMLTPEEIAEKIIQGIIDQKFLLLTHETVSRYIHFRADNHDAWITAMQRFRNKVTRKTGQPF